MMRVFLEEACGLLAQGLAAKRVQVMLEYPPWQMDGPLKGSVVSVGIAAAEIVDAGAGRLAQERAGSCRAALTLRLTLYSPPGEGGAGLYGTLSELLDTVLFGSGWDVQAIRCGDITADRTTGSLRVQAAVQMRVLLHQEDE